MKTFVFWVLGLFTLVFWVFGFVDMFSTLTGNEAYLKDFPPQMIAWIQDFPVWRKIIWGLTVLAGTIGSVMLLMRRKRAAAFLWAASLVMVLTFVGHDILMADGIKYYGQVGIISSSALIVVAILLSWHASAAVKDRRFKH